MWAANHGEIPAVVHALLDVGANPAVRAKNGETAATLMASNEPLRRTSAYRRLTEAGRSRRADRLGAGGVGGTE